MHLAYAYVYQRDIAYATIPQAAFAMLLQRGQGGMGRGEGAHGAFYEHNNAVHKFQKYVYLHSILE